jgi:hypothetical protein
MLISSGIMRQASGYIRGRSWVIGVGQCKRKAVPLVLEGDEGGRLNDELIVLPRRARAHTKKEESAKAKASFGGTRVGKHEIHNPTSPS